MRTLCFSVSPESSQILKTEELNSLRANLFFGGWILIIEAILIAIIAILIIWIYFSGGGTPRTRELTNKIDRLEKENETLRETNEALRSGYGYSSKKVSRSLDKIGSMVRDLVCVKEAIKGSKSARMRLDEKYGIEVSKQLVKNILSSEQTVNFDLRRRAAHEVLVGSIGRDILKGLERGKSLDDSISDAGVPLRIGRERARLLKEVGYLDNHMNLTNWGYEVLEM